MPVADGPVRHLVRPVGRLLITVSTAALVDVYVAETFLVTMALLAAHLMQQGVSGTRVACWRGGAGRARAAR